MASAAKTADPVFLVLAPVLSSSYPSQPTSRSTSIASTDSTLPTSTLAGTAIPETAVDLTAVADPADQVFKERRSSSTSSTSSARRRYLKLGPVHGGDAPGSDFVDIEEE